MSVHGAQAQSLRLDQTIEESQTEVVANVFMYYQFNYLLFYLILLVELLFTSHLFMHLFINILYLLFPYLIISYSLISIIFFNLLSSLLIFDFFELCPTRAQLSADIFRLVHKLFLNLNLRFTDCETEWDIRTMRTVFKVKAEWHVSLRASKLGKWIRGNEEMTLKEKSLA